MALVLSVAAAPLVRPLTASVSPVRTAAAVIFGCAASSAFRGENGAFMKNGGKRIGGNRRFFENGGKPPRLHSTLIYLFPPLKCGKLGNLCTAFWKTAHPIGISYANRFRYLPDGSVCWMLLWGKRRKFL